MINKVLPDAKPAWRDARAGIFLTSALLTAGKLLMGLYPGHAGIGSV